MAKNEVRYTGIRVATTIISVMADGSHRYTLIQDRMPWKDIVERIREQAKYSSSPFVKAVVVLGDEVSEYGLDGDNKVVVFQR